MPLLRTIVSRAGDRDMKPLVGSNRVVDGSVNLTYCRNRTVDDGRTTIRIAFAGRRATGSFYELWLCSNSGRFTAAR